MNNSRYALLMQVKMVSLNIFLANFQLEDREKEETDDVALKRINLACYASGWILFGSIGYYIFTATMFDRISIFAGAPLLTVHTWICWAFLLPPL
jgi:hypothetical protein